ncbi:DUF6380 family protein [Streptomyces lanatus]|uniref:DUF6380 family protein n=1 Tax=Streptomyces lanatus TaxID=66900 RepID=A0ABV1XVL3_9ACTN
MDIPAQGDATGEKRQATLRSHAASLTETTGRGPLNHRRGGRAGEGAR